jgi:voltage-gated potassium channel
MKIHRFVDTVSELFAAYFAVIMIGAGLFSYYESKSVDDSIWWALATAMTVGYGDIAPITNAGRIVGAILMHVSPLLIVPLVTARLASKFIVDNNVFSNEEQEQIKNDLAAIKNHLQKGIPLK